MSITWYVADHDDDDDEQQQTKKNIKTNFKLIRKRIWTNFKQQNIDRIHTKFENKNTIFFSRFLFAEIGPIY